MEIEMRDVGTIKPYSNNPRLNDDAVEVVARSLQEFGFRQPIVVDEESVIIVGHTRFKAALKLGWKQVPVHVARDLTPDQIRAYRIADNKTAEHSDWNYELLPIELSTLKQANYDLGLLGFDEDELQSLLNPDGVEGFTDPDEIPEAPEEPITQRGDLWLLGEHRLLCGDSTSADDVAVLMEGELADLLLTDPPYNVAYEGKTAEALTIENDSMDDNAFREFLKQAFVNAQTVLKEGAGFYIWHADSEGFNFRWACNEAGWKVRQCLQWVKNSMVLGRQDYQWKHEPCLYGWKEGAGHTWLSDRSQTTVLEFDRPSRSEEHPTMKPVPLFRYLIQNSCRVGGLVLDLFGGSGSTLIAAEQLERRAYLMELDPRYCDVIVKRWEAFTGKSALHIFRDGSEQPEDIEEEVS